MSFGCVTESVPVKIWYDRYGRKCRIVKYIRETIYENRRNIRTEWYCGYISFEKPDWIPSEPLHSFFDSVECHGGVTYAEYEEDGIGDNIMTVGFDCIHSGDTDICVTDEYSSYEYPKQTLETMFAKVSIFSESLNRFFEKRKMIDFKYYSDLHCEYNGLEVLSEIDNTGLVIFCGDMAKNYGESQKIFDRLKKANSNFYYVYGNHDLWGVDIVRDNICLNKAVELDDTVIILSTLFCDFGEFSDVPNADYEKAKEYCVRTFADFKNIWYDGHLITPDDMAVEYEKALDFIYTTAEENRDKRIIIATHYMPHFGTIPTCYNRLEQWNFTSSFTPEPSRDSAVREQMLCWIYGHIHTPYGIMDVKSVGNSKLLNNAKGFQSQWHECLNPKFKPN